MPIGVHHSHHHSLSNPHTHTHTWHSQSTHNHAQNHSVNPLTIDPSLARPSSSAATQQQQQQQHQQQHTGTVSPSQLLLPRLAQASPTMASAGPSGMGSGMNSNTGHPHQQTQQQQQQQHYPHQMPIQLPTFHSQLANNNTTSNNNTVLAPATAISPPQLIDLSKSTLLAKRKDKAKSTNSNSGNLPQAQAAMLDITPVQLRVAMVDMVLQ